MIVHDHGALLYVYIWSSVERQMLMGHKKLYIEEIHQWTEISQKKR